MMPNLQEALARFGNLDVAGGGTSGSSGSFITNIFAAIEDAVRKAIASLRTTIKGGFTGDMFGPAFTARGLAAADGLAGMLADGSTTSGGGGGGSIPVAKGGSAQAIVKQMAAGLGWTGSQWSALYKLVQGESSWNPNAANPSSSARGLFQKMTSLHGPIEPTVQGQAQWGLNYIRGAYGNPLNAYQKWSSRSPHWYDDGGMMPDKGIAVNRSGKPERVLDPRTTRNFERLTMALDGATSGRSRAGAQRFILDVGGGRTLTGWIDERVEDVTSGHASHHAGLSRLGA
jgi:hypothetical protein